MVQKKFLGVVVLALALELGGCESETSFGKCVGVAQSDRRDPALVYDLSIWNLYWGIIGAGLVVPPILVLHHEFYCPTGRRVPESVGFDTPATNFLGETKHRGSL